MALKWSQPGSDTALAPAIADRLEKDEVDLALLVPVYHPLGTDQVGNDVLLQAVKSIRTGIVIGALTTAVGLPVAIVLGLAAGYAHHDQDSFYEGNIYKAKQNQYYAEAAWQMPLADWRLTAGLNYRYEDLKSNGVTAGGTPVVGIDDYVYRVPALFGVAEATLLLAQDQEVTVDADARQVLAGRDEARLARRQARAKRPDSPTRRTLRAVMESITPLTLTDPASSQGLVLTWLPNLRATYGIFLLGQR